MNFGKYMLIPIFVAAQATLLVLFAPYLAKINPVLASHSALDPKGGLLIWVAFQSWAVYFLAGCTPKMGLKALIGYAGGIIASALLVELAGIMATLLGKLAVMMGTSCHLGDYGFAAAVFIIVIPLIMVEKVPGFDLVPAYFIGSGAFFSMFGMAKLPDNIVGLEKYLTLGKAELLAAAVGLLFGFITVTFRGWYEKKVSAPKIESK